MRTNYKPLAAGTIAKIVLEQMNAAGIDTEKFKAHTVRMATASKQIDLGEEVTSVMHRGRWSSTGVFQKFYNRAMKLKQTFVPMWSGSVKAS